MNSTFFFHGLSGIDTGGTDSGSESPIVCRKFKSKYFFVSNISAIIYKRFTF